MYDVFEISACSEGLCGRGGFVDVSCEDGSSVFDFFGGCEWIGRGTGGANERIEGLHAPDLKNYGGRSCPLLSGEQQQRCENNEHTVVTHPRIVSVISLASASFYQRVNKMRAELKHRLLAASARGSSVTERVPMRLWRPGGGRRGQSLTHPRALLSTTFRLPAVPSRLPPSSPLTLSRTTTTT